MHKLFEELLEYMKEYEKSPSDVLYVNHARGSCTFVQLADAIKSFKCDLQMHNYYPLEGWCIVGDSWYIEYDDDAWSFSEIFPTKGIDMVPTLGDLVDITVC